MKLPWTKLLTVLVAAVFITGCIRAPAQPDDPEIWTTFPSQFIVGDTYIIFKAMKKLTAILSASEQL